MAKSKRINEKINNLLEIPKEVYSEEAKLTLVGFKELLIENYKGIMEYEDFYIRINTNIGIININGFGLNLNQLTKDDILIKGTIESIDLEKNE